MGYKTSEYNIIEKVNDSFIYYNTRTSAVLKICESENNKIEDMLLNPDAYIDDEQFETLTKNGFIIKNYIDEKNLLREMYEKNYYDKNKLKITLLPAEICNLTCEYCFIYKYGGTYMKENTKKNILQLIINKYSESVKVNI